jgi:flagellar assembly protein FliH
MPLLYSDLTRSFAQMSPRRISLPKDLSDLEQELEPEILEEDGEGGEGAAITPEEARQRAKLRMELTQQISEDLMRQTEDERKTVIALAEAQADDIRREAREEGQNSGYAEGTRRGIEEGRQKAFAEAQEECDAMLEQARLVKKQAKSVLEAAHEKSLSRADRKRNEIIELSIAIAEKIIHAELNATRELILGIAEEACQEFKKRKHIIMNVNPVNVELFEASVSAFSKICPNAEFVVLPDEGIEENGCVIESDTTVLDAQITVQLENVKKALKGLEDGGDE